MKKSAVIFAFSALLLAVQANSDYENSLYKEAVQLVNECGSRSLSLCFKEKALKYIDKLPENIDIGGGVVIKQTEQRLPRKYTPPSLPEEPTAKEAAIDGVLMDRISDYLRSHTLEFKLAPEAAEGARGGGEGGGGGGGGKGGKKGGGYLPILIMMKMKMAMLAAVAMKVIAAIAFKALLMAKVALTISIAIALKKLVEHKHHSQTYEIVAHPHHEEHHGHYDRAWTAQNLAYRGHVNGS